MKAKTQKRTKVITFSALLIALTAVTSQLSIPIQPVPINLALIAVFLSGGILGARLGGLTQAIYILLGAIGVPVFSGLRGGPAALIGPTGGFIFAYLICAIYVGLMVRFCKGKWYLISLVMVSSLIFVYIFGSLWFMIYAKVSFAKAMMSCVIPFILGDMLKAILSGILAARLIPMFGMIKFYNHLSRKNTVTNEGASLSTDDVPTDTTPFLNEKLSPSSDISKTEQAEQ